MKILLINNIASFHSTLSEILNELEGVEAHYISTAKHKYIKDNSFGLIIPLAVSKKKPIHFLYHRFTYKRKINKWIKWADVIYYLWDSLLGEEDLKYASKLKKPIFIEWVGSDIRNPEIVSKINPWYKATFDQGYEYQALELSNFKSLVQYKFAKYHAHVLATPEMKLFIDHSLFSNPKTIMQRIAVDQFTPQFPAIHTKKIKIVHSPSAPIAKGSSFIIKAIEKLKGTLNREIDFVFLNNMSREKVLAEMQSADLFVDQLICGGHGMATCEAMAFGKPVLCYLMPQLYDLGLPLDCPIVNTNVENLEENLTQLIENAALRNEIGVKSRAYVEKYHDVKVVAKQLVEYFNSKLD